MSVEFEQLSLLHAAQVRCVAIGTCPHQSKDDCLGIFDVNSASSVGTAQRVVFLSAAAHGEDHRSRARLKEHHGTNTDQGHTMSEIFLYLTTTGRKSGQPHRIEIWFVEYASRYYLISEKREAAHWVRNILADPQVYFSIGAREAPESVLPITAGIGSTITEEEQPGLAANVRADMDAKYNWSDGLIVQLEPVQAG
jgi:hypothetical protein